MDREPDSGGAATRFDLFAVINQIGETGAGGHYTIDLLINREWVRRDDTDLTVMEQYTATVSTDGVMFWYRRAGNDHGPSSSSAASFSSSSSYSSAVRELPMAKRRS